MDREDYSTPPTSPPPARCSTPTTTASTRSKSAWSSNLAAGAGARGAAGGRGGRGSGAADGSSARRAWARPRRRRCASIELQASSGSRSAACSDEAGDPRPRAQPTSARSPGPVVRAIKEGRVDEPAVLLDEIDKVGTDYRGDPAAAPLEAGSGTASQMFRGHYLDLDLDLSGRAVHRDRPRRHYPRPVAGPDGTRSPSTATPRTTRSPSPATS